LVLTDRTIVIIFLIWALVTISLTVLGSVLLV
jgi:hypothetical protein